MALSTAFGSVEELRLSGGEDDVDLALLRRRLTSTGATCSGALLLLLGTGTDTGAAAEMTAWCLPLSCEYFMAFFTTLMTQLINFIAEDSISNVKIVVSRLELFSASLVWRS